MRQVMSHYKGGGREAILKGFQELHQAFPTNYLAKNPSGYTKTTMLGQFMRVILTTNKFQGYCFILSPERRQIWCRSWYSAGHCQTLVLFRLFLWELQLLTFSCLSDISWISLLLPPRGWATLFWNVWVFLNNEKELKEILVIIIYSWR